MTHRDDIRMTARSDNTGQVIGGQVVTRFAPSPTGRLHLGHAVSAIRAHDFAKARGGRFVLRIEDIDGTRSRAEFVAGILEDVRWLGLEWDELVVQSERLQTYSAALEALKARGLVYPCVCTRADIAASASAPQGDAAPVYPGTCRRHPPTLDVPHCWRLDMAAALAETGPLTWHDATAGTVVADLRAQGDVVLARKDAPSSYHLAVTLDDAAQGVTDVVRGADLFAATHVHRVLQALLGLAVPAYHHHPLISGADGRRLAKRDGAPTLEARRLAGEDGPALADRLRAHPSS
jgi:glutamyl-Q tRNA(Asp) synthetase